MPNRLVVFPAGKETEARAYAAWTDAQWQTITGNPGDVWAYVRNDVYGQWVVPYLGPPVEWNYVEVPEPAGGEAKRVDGVLADSVTWPNDDI